MYVKVGEPWRPMRSLLLVGTLNHLLNLPSSVFALWEKKFIRISTADISPTPCNLTHVCAHGLHLYTMI